MKHLFYIFLSIVCLTAFNSCETDDNFSDDASLRLEFSTDTLRFDTVFTTIGSSTKRLLVYNKNKDGIILSNVNLVSEGKSGFRINVDGRSGNNISGVEILGNDSIFVFVEVTVDPLNNNNPLLITDSIRFQFNGVTQYASLEAVGQDVTILNNKTLSTNVALSDDKPYLVYGKLTVAKDAKLTLNEGAKLYFHSGSGLYVDGQLEALGTIQKPVVLQGDRTDNFSANIPYNRVPGQWQGVYVSANSYNNKLENVRIINSIYGILFKEAMPAQTKATILNTIIQNTSREGILSINNKLVIANSLIANSGKSSVRLIGGEYTFVQNTIVNYMNAYWGFFREQALVLSNTGPDSDNEVVTFPLRSTLIANSIISGNSNTELRLIEKEGIALEYKFINCLIRNNGTDDNDFVNTVWGVDPAFKFIYNTSLAEEFPDRYYFYNFELTKDSPAIAKASRLYATEYPFDIKGVSRLGTTPADIGCYQYEAR